VDGRLHEQTVREKGVGGVAFMQERKREREWGHPTLCGVLNATHGVTRDDIRAAVV
jgi:hypothetical protein